MKDQVAERRFCKGSTVLVRKAATVCQSSENVKTKVQRDGWHKRCTGQRVVTEEEMRWRASVPINYIWPLITGAALFEDVLVFVADLRQMKKGGRKRMSDTLIRRSLTVIMAHLSTAPDRNSYNTGCRTSIRACICLWVSITALIPGGIRHIFQCGAIKTPGEAWNRWTTCRKKCRDGWPGQARQIRWTCAFSCSTNDKKLQIL